MTPANRQADICAYCGLPLAPSWRGSADAVTGALPAFCCIGCRIAASVTDARGAEGHIRWMLARLGLSIFFSMNVMVFAMALWSQDWYGASLAEHTALAGVLWQLFRYLGLLFSLPVLFLLGGPIVDSVASSLRRGGITTDVLILLGVLAAYLYSAVSVIRGYGHVYFEVACMVLVMVTLGRWLEATGKHRASEIMDGLADLLPAQVRVLRAGSIQTVPRDEVAVGERLRVLPGERFAVDGRVVSGIAEVDEQILTGESQPVVKQPGDLVYSGTLNVQGDVQLQVTAAAGSETVSRMIELIRRARLATGDYARLADRVAALFVPAVLAIALAAGGYHTIVSGLDTGILASLAVVLIACPCALGIATPMAVWCALGHAARKQVLFRSGSALEQLAGITAIRLDKTGTLTTGRSTVEDLVADPGTPIDVILRRAGGLAANSSHHFAAAIERFVSPRAELALPRDVHTYAGRGVSARFGPAGERVELGSSAWMHDLGYHVDHQPLGDAVAAAREDGVPFSCVAWDGRIRAVITFREHLRPHAKDTLQCLRKLGIDIAVLTGDHRSRAARIAAELEVAVESEQLPDDKVAAVRRARQRFQRVAMVGDGINDAPALAASDVGIAMGCGADLSRDTATVCLVSDDLTRLPWAIQFARRTMRVIRQNLFWAFAYNALGILLAVSGRLNPIWAAMAMAGSSFLVISNSLRLTRETETCDATHRAPVAVSECQKVGAELPCGQPTDASFAETPAG